MCKVIIYLVNITGTCSYRSCYQLSTM